MVSGVAQLLNKAACWLLISALDCFYKTHTVTLTELCSGHHRDSTDTMTVDVFSAEQIILVSMQQISGSHCFAHCCI